MKTKNGKIIGFLAVALGFCWACEDTADLTSSGSGGTKSRVSLMPGGIEGLRAAAAGQEVTPPADSLHTKKGITFETSDTIGLFSDGGDMRESGGGGGSNGKGFSNLKLGFNGTSFDSEEEFVKDLAQLGQYFAYYPYKPDVEAGTTVYADSTKGHEKVIDFLTTNYAGKNEELVSTNNFYHTFAVVRVKRGSGFEGFNGSVAIQLKTKVKTMRINWSSSEKNNAVLYVVELGYDSTAVTAKERRLPAYETVDGNDTVWDAIVPCRPMMWHEKEDATAGGVTVEAIVLNPKDGGSEEKEIEIPVNNREVFQGHLVDSAVTYGVRGGFIYTAIIRKVGLDIGVYPYDVKPWKEESIGDTLATGIGSTGDYQQFVNTYNGLVKEGKSELTEEDIEKLAQYGDTVDGKFTILLTSDLDFDEVDMEEGVSLTNLVIPFNGQGHTIKGFHSGSSFCDTLSAALTNVTFDDIFVTQAPEDSIPIGLLATKMTDKGSIEDCHVEGVLIGNGKVGAAVGTMEGGTIKGCSFSGFMFGEADESHQNIVGVFMGSGDIGEDNTNNMEIITDGLE